MTSTNKKIIKVIAVICISLFTYYNKNVMSVEIPLSKIRDGDLTKVFKDGYSIVAYKNTIEEKEKYRLIKDYIVFEDTQCLVVIKNDNNSKYFLAGQYNTAKCGLSYDMAGKGIGKNHGKLHFLPFNIVNNNIVVKHGYFDWKEVVFKNLCHSYNINARALRSDQLCPTHLILKKL